MENNIQLDDNKIKEIRACLNNIEISILKMEINNLKLWRNTWFWATIIFAVAYFCNTLIIK